MRKPSIGLRLTVWYVAIFALAQLIFGAGMWFVLRHRLYDIVDDNLESQADDFKNYMQAQKKDASIAKLQDEVAEEYDLEHSSIFLQVYLGDGQWLYRSAFLQLNPLAAFEPNAVGKRFFKDSRLGGKPFRFIVERLQVNGHVYTAEIGQRIDDVIGTLSEFRSKNETRK